MIERLQLEREWALGELIGEGGFGRVYAAKSRDQAPAVAKIVPKLPGAQRELLFVDLGDVRNVVPIIDSGETDDSWVLIMPRALKSLRQYLDDVASALDVLDATLILSDIATALADLDGEVVHRDLKPENVLFLDDNWCLADFGIARYAESTTAPDTRKFAWSPPYAAPERWREERANTATDVYSFGIVAFELLSGARPFLGPRVEDYRDQHLHSDPPSLPGVPTAIEALVEECLYKAQSARPSPANLLARLTRFEARPKSKAFMKLQDANRAEVERRSERARRDSEQRSEAERRASLAVSAVKGMRRIAGTLQETIIEAAPSASVNEGPRSGWSIVLNQVQLEYSPTLPTVQSPWGSRSYPAFDVIAVAELSLSIPRDRFGYEGRSHSLWFCDAQVAGQYQWFETAFMISPFARSGTHRNPLALAPGEQAALALGNVVAEFDVAWPFTPLIIGELDEFVDRWVGWFGDAAQGRLRHPSTMPERPPQGSWRKS